MSKEPIAVCITDTHQDEDNFETVKFAHQQAIELAKKLELSYVFHLGDHFNSRISQKLSTLLGFKSILDIYEESGICLITISGNHDKTNQSIEESYLDVYSSESMILFRGDGDEDVCININGTNIYMLSYFTESAYQSRLEKMAESLDTSKKNVLMTHYGIDGVLDNDARKVQSNIKENNLKIFDRILIGHYHNASDVNSKIRYIGSTDPRSFGEDDDKGATILYSDMSVSRFKFKFKSYNNIIINDFTDINMDELIDKYSSDDHVKIQFVGDKIELAKINKKKLEAMGIKVDLNDTSLINIEVGTGEIKTTIGMERGDILNHLEEYGDQNGIEKEEILKISKRL